MAIASRLDIQSFKRNPNPLSVSVQVHTELFRLATAIHYIPVRLHVLLFVDLFGWLAKSII